MTARSDAQGKQIRIQAMALELDIDYCANTFGSAPCTASGIQCYNTFGTCKDKPNFVKTIKTYKFCSRGMKIPAGETLRPYIIDGRFTPTEIPLGGGLAMRGQITLTMADEACSDYEADKYASTRTAAGTFWTRFLARNHNTQGRPARLRKGFVTLDANGNVVEPFDWSTFQTELYVIESIKGVDARGNVQIILSDITKGLDKNNLPIATDGKLLAGLKGVENTGYAVSATATSIVLATEASPLDAAYVGMECYLTQNYGAGQRRTITAYVGATRTAVVAAWQVIPNQTTVYEVSAISLHVGVGRGAKYDDPVSTSIRQFVRVGNEIIEYTAKAGDVLSWPDTTYRAQFGTKKTDHSEGDGVQLCFAPIQKSVTDVIKRLLNAAGIVDANIDLAGLAVEDTDWLGNNAIITACISAPEKASKMLDEILTATNLSVWWNFVEQKVKFKANMPHLLVSATAITPDEAIMDSTSMERYDDLRITSHAISYAMYSATDNARETKNFSRTDVYADADASSANEYNSTTHTHVYTRWMSQENALHVNSLVARKVSQFRNAPIKIKLKLDPRNEVSLGQLIDVTTRLVTDSSGAPLVTRMRVTKILDEGNFSIEAISTTFSRRYGFIAPNGYPNFNAATSAQKNYTFISANTGLMSDLTTGYIIS